MKQDRKNTDYKSRRVLITAGPTIEDIDPVRFISNRSTGRMGIAIAVAAANRGAQVILVHGPLRVDVPSQPDINPVPVRSAQDMYDAVMAHVGDVDAAILCAAVADFTPVAPSSKKIKKGGGELLRLELTRTRDILAAVGAMENKPLLVGFAAETEDVARNARKKLEQKNCDILCANDVSKDESGFESETNRVTIYRRDGVMIELPLLSKRETAERILDEISERIQDDRKGR